MFQLVLSFLIVGLVFYFGLSGIFWIKNKVNSTPADKPTENPDDKKCCGKCPNEKSEEKEEVKDAQD